MSYQVLGLAGQQGAGKDYTFETLRHMLGDTRRVMRMGFADGVRREVSREVLTALGVTIEDDAGMGTWVKPYTAGQRWVLQQWGTEFRRAADPQYWVDYGMQYIDGQAQDGDLWCITDVRFANEAAAIGALSGGKVALVSADLDVRARRLGVTEVELAARSVHSSEVIDFTADLLVHSSDGLVLDHRLLEWLGLMERGATLCIKCTFGVAHPFHDNGDTFSG